MLLNLKKMKNFSKIWQGPTTGMAQSVAHQAEVAVSRVRHSAILLYILSLTVSFHKFIYIDILYVLYSVQYTSRSD